MEVDHAGRRSSRRSAIAAALSSGSIGTIPPLLVRVCEAERGAYGSANSGSPTQRTTCVFLEARSDEPLARFISLSQAQLGSGGSAPPAMVAVASWPAPSRSKQLEILSPQQADAITLLSLLLEQATKSTLLYSGGRR